MDKKKRNKGAQWLQYIVGIAVGGAGGYLGMGFLDRMHGGRMKPAELITGVLWLVFCLYAAVLVQIIVHESGHLVCGLLSGYKFSSFRVGGIILVKKKDGMKLGRYSLMGTGGQCLLAPPDLIDGKIPYILYNLGGSIFNLLSAAASLLICLTLDGHGYLQILGMALFIFGVFLALMNAIPLCIGGVNNDGYNAFHLGKEKEAVRCFWLQLKMNEQLTAGVRLREMPQAWFEPAPEEMWNNSLCAAVGVFAVSRAIDEKDFHSALAMGERLMEKASGMIGIQKYALKAELIFCRLMLYGPGEELRKEYEDKDFQGFLKRSSSMLSVLRLQYACGRLLNRDEEAARKWLKCFEKAGRYYPFDGEILTERELISYIDGLWMSGSFKAT